MTGITEKYMVEIERTRTLRTVCDKCQADIPKPASSQAGREFTLQFAEIENYSDCGSKKGWRVPDLCNDCAAWLRTVLEAGGVHVESFEVDW